MRSGWNPLIPVGALAMLLASLTPLWGQLPPTIPAPRPSPPPAEKYAPRVGQKAPDFTLPDQYGRPVRLSEQLEMPAANRNGGGKKNRGCFWFSTAATGVLIATPTCALCNGT